MFKKLTIASLTYLFCSIVIVFAGAFVAFFFKNPICISIGSSVLAAGCVNIAMYLYVHSQQSFGRALDVYARFGIDDVYESRGAAIKGEYDKHLKEARRAIDVLGFGQQNFRQDYANDFSAWRERTHMRILLIDPDFPSKENSLANLRDREEGNSEGQIAADVAAFIDFVKPIIGTTRKGSLQVKLYRAIPAINLFRIDGVLFWGPYLMHSVSRNAPTLKVREGGILYERLLNHFEALWNDPNRCIEIK